MERRRFLIGMGSAVVVVAAGCGTDDDSPAPVEESGADRTTTTAESTAGSTEADAALIAAAVGKWEAHYLRDDFTYEVTIAADGTFTMRDPESAGDDADDLAGTWELDDGTLTIELVVPSEGVDERWRCQLLGAALETEAMEMVTYTVDDDEQLDADGLDVEVEWQGRDVVLDGSWHCIPIDVADLPDSPGLTESDLVGRWTVTGDPSQFCSVTAGPLELTLTSFTSITFDEDGTFEGELWCGGTLQTDPDQGVGAEGTESPETATGRWALEGDVVALGDVEADGEPLSSDDATFTTDNPAAVELDGDRLYVRVGGAGRVAYQRAS